MGILYSLLIGGLAGWLFTELGINFIDGFIGDILKGAIGAAVVLFIAGLFKKK